MKITSSAYMMRLGKYKFSVSSATFDSLKFNSSYRWQKHETHSKSELPPMQYLGQGENRLDLEGVIYPSMVENGLQQVELMRQEAESGEPLSLVFANGNIGLGSVLGNYCIESISEQRTLFTRDGLPREIKFNLSLIRASKSQNKVS